VLDVAVAPTCITVGLTEGKRCSACDVVMVKQEIVPATGHKDTNADFRCDVCGAELCAKHVESIISGKAATCTETGLTDGSKCANCGDVLAEQKVIPALGHDWAAGVITTKPGCETPGVKTYTCSRDTSHSYTEEIPASGHQHETNVIQMPTCSSVGQMQQNCSVCGDDQYVEIPIDPETHEWSEWTVTTEATFTRNGEETRVCRLNGDHFEKRSILAAVCLHTCATCSGCTEEHSGCKRTPKCGCVNPSTLLVDTCSGVVVEHTIKLLEAGQTVAVDIQKIFLPSTDGTTTQEVVHPFEEFILNTVEGMKVDSCFEVEIKVDGKPYVLNEGETATVSFYVGAKYAQAIDNGEMLLVHITDNGTVTYGKGEGNRPITVIKDREEYTGDITFTTDSFSPFVLVSLPGELEISLDAVGTVNTCAVSISANRAYNCSLYLAAYDSYGKMLGVTAVDSCNLAANPRYALSFNGTAACVQAFMIETDGSLAPRCAAVVDDDLSQ